MGYFQQHLLVFMAMSFAIAMSPVFSVLGWEERYLPDPKVCWGEIFNKADGCVHDLYASVVNKKINMRFQCCEAIQGLDYKCKNWMFNHGRFTPEFGNRVQRFCATLGVALPPSYRIYYPQNPGHGDLGD